MSRFNRNHSVVVTPITFLKALLISKKEKGLTLETIAEQCGFNSRITFNNAFKKVIGVTTTEWLRLNQNEK